MSRDNLNPPPGMNLDADAVCAQCGTVNPEATLICKVCGNNLRDQRALRMQSDHLLESVGEPTEGRRWIAGTLTVIGAIIVLLVAVNVNSIANYVVAGGLDSGGASSLWYGDQHAEFDALKEEVKKGEPGAEVVKAAIEAAAPLPEGTDPPEIDGLYVLMPPDAEADAVPFGTAAIKGEGSEFAFVAILSDGSEVRGWATQRSAGLLTAQVERASILANHQFQPVYGYAQRTDDGTFAGWGQRQSTDSDLLRFTAYRLPATPAG